MDQILVHMIIASYPNQTWETILPALRKLQLEPESLSVIANHLRSPEPIGALLDQLNRDYAVPLLALCRRIAEQNGTVSDQEAEILTAIEQRCGTVQTAIG